MRIYVTEDDIKNGKPSKVKSCPIALALKRRGFRGIRVDPSWVRIDNRGFAIPLPEVAKVFIKKFDNKEKVKQFSFYLEVKKPR